jgi:hypothetical protein
MFRNVLTIISDSMDSMYFQLIFQLLAPECKLTECLQLATWKKLAAMKIYARNQ